MILYGRLSALLLSLSHSEVRLGSYVESLRDQSVRTWGELAIIASCGWV